MNNFLTMFFTLNLLFSSLNHHITTEQQTNVPYFIKIVWDSLVPTQQGDSMVITIIHQDSNNTLTLSQTVDPGQFNGEFDIAADLIAAGNYTFLLDIRNQQFVRTSQPHNVTLPLGNHVTVHITMNQTLYLPVITR